MGNKWLQVSRSVLKEELCLRVWELPAAEAVWCEKWVEWEKVKCINFDAEVVMAMMACYEMRKWIFFDVETEREEWVDEFV